jgi:hypothetical protein
MTEARINIDPKVWQEGFEAGDAARKQCPYPVGSSEAFAWQSGYVEGHAKREACPTCKYIREECGGFGPRHDGSPNCESGSIASGGKVEHCSCSICF